MGFRYNLVQAIAFENAYYFVDYFFLFFIL